MNKVESIKIVINTNIPGSKDIILTKSLIHLPKVDVVTGGEEKDSETTGTGEYPYITKYVKLTKNNFLNKNGARMEYNEIVDFFFSSEKYTKKVNSIIGISPQNEISKPEEEENLKSNLMLMLSMLFPTSFPLKNNVLSSFDDFIKDTNNTNIDLLNKSRYSYINYNGKIYTITKVVWLNDILNNPNYISFIKEYNNYKIWCKNQSLIIEKEVKEIDKNIFKIFEKEILIDNIYKELVNDIKNQNEEVKSRGKQYKSDREINLNNFLSSLKSVKEEFDKNNNNTGVNKYQVVKEIYDYIDSMEISFKNIRDLVTTKSAQVFKKKFDEVVKLKKSIDDKEKLNKKYFTDKNIDINFDPPSGSEYDTYRNFSKKIKDFILSSKKSSNENLQLLIYNYGKNIKDDEVYDTFGNVIEQVINNCKNKEEKCSYKNNYIYTGFFLNNTSSPKYEVNLSIDLIEGEVNNDNVKNIKCRYSDAELVKRFDKIKDDTVVHDWSVEENREHFLVFNNEKKNTEKVVKSGKKSLKRKPKKSKKSKKNTRKNCLE
jgi:hypothetical protein